MALGATSAGVLWLEVVRSLVIVVAGLAAGLLLWFATHRALINLFIWHSSLDLNVYAAPAAVLAISAKLILR